jgi:hypothetical protein
MVQLSFTNEDLVLNRLSRQSKDRGCKVRHFLQHFDAVNEAQFSLQS